MGSRNGGTKAGKGQETRRKNAVTTFCYVSAIDGWWMEPTTNHPPQRMKMTKTPHPNQLEGYNIHAQLSCQLLLLLYMITVNFAHYYTAGWYTARSIYMHFMSLDSITNDRGTGSTVTGSGTAGLCCCWGPRGVPTHQRNGPQIFHTCCVKSHMPQQHWEHWQCCSPSA